MASLTQFVEEWSNGHDYIIARTSGSTGAPKEIRLLKSDMSVSAAATNGFFGINESSTLALPLSLDYIAGKMMAVRAFLAGANLLELPVSNSVALAGPVDLLSVVPTQMEWMLNNLQLSKPHLAKAILIGGAPVSPTLEAGIADAGLNAWLGYGMTETCSHVALRKIGEGNTFKAMPGISFSIDSRGCLAVHSSRFSWQELVTNDMAELVSPTEFRWLGRYDNVVNSGGLKLHPEILENLYRKHLPELPPFFLHGEPDERLGQRLVMTAEPASVDLLALLRNCGIEHRLLPKRIITVDRLPMGNNGKLKRK